MGSNELPTATDQRAEKQSIQQGEEVVGQRADRQELVEWPEMRADRTKRVEKAKAKRACPGSWPQLQQLSSSTHQLHTLPSPMCYPFYFLCHGHAHSTAALLLSHRLRHPCGTQLLLWCHYVVQLMSQLLLIYLRPCGQFPKLLTGCKHVRNPL